MTGELRALTGARGLAAWFVVLYHLRRAVADLPGWAEGILAKGSLAVDFFFLLSGFVIALAWHDRLREGGLASVPPFLRRRIARVWPLHLVILAGTVALATLLTATGRANEAEYPWAELPLHLLLVHNWRLTDTLTWNDPAWSISAEFAAYLLFPLLALAVDPRRWPTPLLLAGIAAPLVLLHLAMRGQPTLGQDIPSFGVVRCLAEFATGALLCALWRRHHDASPALPALAAAALFATWIAGAPETLAVPAALAALLLALALSAGRPGNPFESRTLHALGEISYATYLGHFLLWQVFKLLLVDDATAVPPILVALYLLLVLASSIALYHLVERPAQAWVNAIGFRSRRAARALP